MNQEAGFARRSVLLAVVFLAGVGCAPTRRDADRRFAAGDLAGAAVRYEAALAAGHRGGWTERALFRLGVAHATPGSAAFDPAAAQRDFSELVERYPTGPYARPARALGLLLRELDTLGEHRRALTAELEAAQTQRTAEAAMARSTTESLQKELDQSQAEVQKLRARVAELDKLLERLRHELDQLKRIDLGDRR